MMMGFCATHRLTGVLSDVRVYNHMLTSAEIATLVAAGPNAAGTAVQPFVYVPCSVLLDAATPHRYVGKLL